GADYPRYVQELTGLGIKRYETFVTDGNTIYWGHDDFMVESGGKYAALKIAEHSHKEQFITDIKAHQNGASDFPTFCNQCAESGVEKWVADLLKMTCTYYDLSGKELLR